MRNLADQLRVRFSALGQDNVPAEAYSDGESLRRRNIESAKGGDKNEENWFWQRFSLQPSRDFGSSFGDDDASALAAAAYAIASLEKEEHQKQLKMCDERETSLRNNTSRRGNITAKLPISISRKFSDREGNEMRSPNSLKISEEERKMPLVATMQKSQEKASAATYPTAKATNKVLKQTMKLANTDNIRTSSAAPPSADSPFSNADDKSKKRSPQSPRSKESKADLWKQAETKRITDRYEKRNSLILSWEEKKKEEAKRQLQRRESDLEKERAEAIQRFRRDVIVIEQIAGKERTLAEERKSKLESKANQEVKQIRMTGKAPANCFCF
ncbi:hypothetical protein Syun_023416 [Stephania yunnanensis]|uniref:Remorin C-terminal domain-containing protein n=1 Tax=Stephania yunnanensis TaxID=152371 RepID=A0AAP0FBS5_9MAGN